MAKKLNLSKFAKLYCFDLDGVICKTKKNFYTNSKPIKPVINLINKLYEQNNYILIFTSRFMGRSNENVRLANRKGYKFTKKQLNNWGLKYHRLKLGKPSYDIIIDDKSIDYNSNWLKRFKL